MNKIIMLGTGCGTTIDLYNTCFIIQNKNGNFLVDTGGSIELIKRLKKVNIELNEINNIFISHSHTDHILGLMWFFKKLYSLYIKNKLDKPINIYCNDEVYNAIKEVSKHILQSQLIDLIDKVINFHVLEDNEKIEINGINYTFFDIQAKGNKQYGFECIIDNKRLVFLGDEPLNHILYERVSEADYVMHEAFCLDSEENIFHPYQKNHSTVKSTANTMNELKVKNLILYHTEESHGEKRKELYTEEGKQYFNGNVIVPNDLEIIDIV